MTDQPRRRGRRPLHNLPTPQAEEVTADPAPTRRRRRGNMGGFHLKLAAPAREGFHRHWFIDKPGRLAEAEELAYDFVREPGIQSDSPDSRVRRLTGTDAQGAPQYSYLMETPLEEYELGQADKEAARAPFEKALSRGQDPFAQLQDSYGEGKVNVSNRG